MQIAPRMMSNHEVREASINPAIAATKKEIKAAFFTEAAVAAQDPTRRIGPTRSKSVPLMPSE